MRRDNVSLYDKFHKNSTIPRRIIGRNNFTYLNLLRTFDNELFKEGFKKIKGRTVLDIGSGTGAISLYLAKKGFNVVGIEISKKAVDISEKSARSFNLRNKTRFIRGDFNRGLKVNKKFDLVICSEILEHLKNEEVILFKIHKLIKKGGKIIITVPSYNAPLYRIGYAKDFDRRVGHLRRYTERSLKELTTRCGFKTKEIKKTEGILRNLLFLSQRLGFFIKFIRGPLTYLVSFLDWITLKIFGESQIILVGVKPDK
ncbi:TPA: hypothetical protein DEQ95_02660 [Candidatus Beckwithbacteria bacterium]|nr:MAG: Methylase involved in ubiquinone/menaquinone biosynthesis [Candidatus Beckwithbacteria bacterium GW2011_GWC1_49_16]KKS53415.1 MAG: Methyltransferase type 11 [Candidatus Gottesmanbacteria bacterium GW2011_GWA1_42_26]KKU71077.1 MAG: Methyltransferase type 11 [Candidatus Beckwithbacteria bacterium GW2011_GWA2_47_25]KKW04750.1 MAG: Methyltransferase type 11 [Candidatus Beckwithbacteria bacterium GW2011_GWC2_49_11]OGD49057.1 MAG: hypothetical protein A2877_01850 [Candidatus Beckwithbacteria 